MKNKKVLALVMAAAMTFGGTYSAYAMEDDKYTDVASTADYFASIEKMVDLNVMQGKTDTEFGINEPVSRADLVSYMYKLLKSPKANGSLVYADVAGTEFEDAVIWAESNDMFSGLAESFFKDGNFDAADGITRAEACMMLMNYAKTALKIDTSKNVADSISNYEDAGDVLAVYDVAVKWAVGNDLINEREDQDGKILPNEAISKKETAEFLYKLLKMVTDESVELLELETEKDVLTLAGSTNLVKPDWSGNTGNDNGITVDKGHVHHWVENVVEGKFHTEQILVKPAWTETIEHKEEGHYETVVDKEAWTEEIPLVAEQGHAEYVKVVDKEAWTEEIKHPAETHEKWVVDKEAWTEEIKHPAETEDKWVVDKEAVYETVHHPAVTEKKWIVDKEAWTEEVQHPAETEDKWVVDKEAWTETINHPEEGHEEVRTICHNCGADITGHAADHIQENALNGCLAYGDKVIWIVDKPAWTETINHPEEGHTETVVTKPAWTEKVEHPEEGHYEDVVIKEAWDEKVLVSPEEGHTETVVTKPAWTEKVEHPEEGHYETVVDKEAWTETIEHPEESHMEWQWVVDVPGKTEIIEHPAETHKEWVVDKKAWTETINHPAEYKEIVVADKPSLLETVCSECGKVKSRVEIVPKDYLKKKA